MDEIVAQLESTLKSLQELPIVVDVNALGNDGPELVQLYWASRHDLRETLRNARRCAQILREEASRGAVDERA